MALWDGPVADGLAIRPLRADADIFCFKLSMHSTFTAITIAGILMKNMPDKKQLVSVIKRYRFWLMGTVATLLLLLLTVWLFAGRFLSDPAVKHKIQLSIVAATGIDVDWQSVELNFSPYPTIALQQATLAAPDRGQARVAEISISIEVLPLLLGDLRLTRVVLKQPQISLTLPAPEPDQTPAQSDLQTQLEENLTKVLASLGRVAPDLHLLLYGGRLSIGEGDQKKVELENLDLKLGLSINGPRWVQVKLGGEASALSVRTNGQLQTLKEIELMGVIGFKDGALNVKIERFAVAEPGLQLTGNLTSDPHAHRCTLSLAGSDIDVDATRRTVLALAGQISPVREIFDYLRGGRVPQISLTARGKTLSELGDLNSMVIKGQLQQGKISIPEIKLDLTEVDGDVLISEGVLQGDGMSASLGEAKGHDGTLKIGLTESNNIFSLEVMLKADLAHAQKILKHIVHNETFSKETDKITNLKGTGTGKLILGDRLTDIKARVDVTAQNLVANYQRVPFPIAMSKGHLSFTENRIVLKGLSGKLGDSFFSGVSCIVDWEKTLHLTLGSGQFDLALDEVYPWVATFDGAKEYFKVIKKVGGRLDLSTVSLKGAVGNSALWQYAAAGSVKALSVETPSFPDRINLARGDFKLDKGQLSFQNLKTASLDADLILSGKLKGFPKKLDQVELYIDGKLGQDSVVWLRDRYKLPAAYTVRTPLTFSKTQVIWQPDAILSFKGNVSITKGPDLTLDVAYRPEQLQIKQLHVKDQYSDAHMAFSHGADESHLNFTGALQHETLQTLFVAQSFGKGHLLGDLAVKIPRAKQAAVTAKGHLSGENLLLPLPEIGQIALERIVLDAEGSRINAEGTELLWNNLTWNSFKAAIDVDQDKIKVSIAEADLCGIKCPGVVTIAGTDLALDFSLTGQGLNVATDYSCLTKGRVKMTGTMDFSSKVSAQGTAKELLGNLSGPLEMTFTNGVITEDKMLSRTLEVLNITEIVKGKLPDMASTGFPYVSMTLQGEFQNGKLLIEKLYMDGKTLDVLGKGEIDLQQKTVNLELLAAPFKTIDSIVKKIPGVNYLLAGSVVAIPVSIKGDLADPKVKVVSASAVGSSLLGLGERIIKAPFKLVESVVPRSKEKEP